VWDGHITKDKKQGLQSYENPVYPIEKFSILIVELTLSK
jgi:hypothetical protein